MSKTIRITLLSILVCLLMLVVSCSKKPAELMKYVSKTELELASLDNLECTLTETTEAKTTTITVIIKKDEMYAKSVTKTGDTEVVSQEWIKANDGKYFKYTKENNDPIKSKELEYEYYERTSDTSAIAGKKYYSKEYNEELRDYLYVESETFSTDLYEKKVYTFKTERELWLKVLELDPKYLPEDETKIKDGGTPNAISYTDQYGNQSFLNLTKWKSLSTGIDGYHVKEFKTTKDGVEIYYFYKYPWDFTSTAIPEIK